MYVRAGQGALGLRGGRGPTRPRTGGVTGVTDGAAGVSTPAPAAPAERAQSSGEAERAAARTAAPDWDAVFADCLPRVFNYLRFRTGDDRLAEALAAQTFERAWRARRDYRHDLAAFSTWLLAIARNTAASHFRTQQRRLAREIGRASCRERV